MSALLLCAALGWAAERGWDESKNAELLERTRRQAIENVERERARAPVAPAPRPSGVGGDPRVELYGALVLLAAQRSPAPARWAALAGHAAVSATRALRETGAPLLGLRLALSCSVAGEKPFPLSADHAARAGGRERAARIVRDMEDFAARARFEQWLEESRAQRRADEERLSARAAELARAARYLGPGAATVRLVPSRLLPAGEGGRLDAAGEGGGESWLVLPASEADFEPRAAQELLYAEINRLDPALSARAREAAVKALSRRLSLLPPATGAERLLRQYEAGRERYPSLADFWPRLRPALDAR